MKRRRSLWPWLIAALFSVASNTQAQEFEKETREFIRLFHTFNGQPVDELLGKYGITIEYAIPSPIEQYWDARHPYDKHGDVLYALAFMGKPKSMPCHLERLQDPQWGSTAEVTRRGNTLFATREDDVGPLVYWAATGKCSKSFMY
jgi:hypothetical protein